ncbi:protein-L-isoaspartate(D-aspartate) O-methyltransferase [Vibrio algivorus]|uniref:Protein-L-isoaspartate O-methyltransferase n=1 Tax=Vibrio algivorus TaxID=1667024 RepID=A0A557PHF5_9VIBR|nr:protein-L-isoaspartate(D-aspartate) O-methyltransferase [Vibrio algivorus]TVO40083.1 protein-L-isoaspartate(D-aspartate) O-methyltransferase [Vibrio algivorus]GLT14930.1 protein-L-isoaspartate O-methyltransferase [Vibrio algivorus]
MKNIKADQLVSILQNKGIKDPQLLEVMRSLPREYFLSEAMRHQAYDNNALPIGAGQTISQPYIVAKMTELLNLKPNSRVLEVGTGSGYQTAVLSKMVDHVYSIERIKSLQWDAKRRLKHLDIYNVSTKHGDGWQGWPSKGPFDAIIVTAAASHLPQPLVAQLAEGGVLVVPIGDEHQELIKIEKKAGECISTLVEVVRFVPLIAGDLA